MTSRATRSTCHPLTVRPLASAWRIKAMAWSRASRTYSKMRADLRRGMSESLLYDAIDHLASFQMRLKLLRAPAGLESLHQISRTDDRATLRAHHFHRAASTSDT